MIIDNTIRKHWGTTPNQIGSRDEEEFVTDNELGTATTSGLEIGTRFRVSAQEWLLTWRVIE